MNRDARWTKVVPVSLGVLLVVCIVGKYFLKEAFAWPDTLLVVMGVLLVVSPLLSNLKVKDWGELSFHRDSASGEVTRTFDAKEDAKAFPEDPQLASAKML